MQNSANETAGHTPEAPSEKSSEPAVSSSKALAGLYIFFALAGACFGLQGVSLENREGTLALTPSARVGYALAHELPATGVTQAWTQLESDIAELHSSWPALDRPLFDLVIATRGLDNRGQARPELVKHQCESLQLSSCSDAALALLCKSLAQEGTAQTGTKLEHN